MEAINELRNAVGRVIEAANKIGDEANKAIWDGAPLIIHQAFCRELVRIMEENPKLTTKEVPGATDLLTAIRVLEGLYPGIKAKGQ